MNLPSNGLHYYSRSKPVNREFSVDLCIYGGTSGGIAAATAARRLGLTVIVLEQSAHPGGMTAGGLGCTDIGNMDAIGGIAREYYRRVGSYYNRDEHWWFEPKVAEQVFQDWITEERIPIHYNSFLARVEMRDRRIVRLWTENRIEVSARMFLDCSYEGDLMAAANVSFMVGRESNSCYGETLNGAQVRAKHQFDLPVNPYRIEGDPASGLLPGIEPGTPLIGLGDHRIQAYNFRLCLSRNPGKHIPFTKPAGYQRLDYELLARYCRQGYIPEFVKFEPLMNDKVDMNNHGAFSSDYIGQNYRFPTASYQEREQIFQAHVNYIKGLMWFLKQDEVVDSSFRSPYQTWGWAADEFVDCGGFPHALYVREARRMVSDTVITEHHCCGALAFHDSIGLGAYTMDSHNCRRVVIDGRVKNEGDVQNPCARPYSISYRTVVPRKGECENLFVPFCLSASHIGFGSIRMEPVFMILAESCVHAADLAIQQGIAAQEVSYEVLRSRLEEAGQILEWNSRMEPRWHNSCV